MNNENKPLALFQGVSDPVGAAMQLGEAFASSGMFGCTKPAQGAILALQCLTSGLTPFEVTQTYHLLDGKLSMKADAMLGRYKAAGGKVIWGTRTAERVKARWVYGENDLEMEVTMQELVASGVALGKGGELKENYKRHPRQMLTARLISEAVRLLAPEVVSGIYTPEEVSDFGPVERVEKPAQVQVVEPEALPPAEDPEQEFRDLLGEHYTSAVSFFKTDLLTLLAPKVQKDIRTRTSDLIAKL
jgi:hypothetical protein